MVQRVRAALVGGLGEALVLFFILRLGYSAYGFLLSVLHELPGPCTWEGGPTLHATGLDFRLVGIWQQRLACSGISHCSTSRWG